MSGFPGLLPASGPGCAPRAVPPLRDRRPPGPAAAAKAEDSWGTRLGLRVLPLQPTLPLPEAGSQRPPGGYPGPENAPPYCSPALPAGRRPTAWGVTTPALGHRDVGEPRGRPFLLLLGSPDAGGAHSFSPLHQAPGVAGRQSLQPAQRRQPPRRPFSRAPGRGGGGPGT